MKTIEKKKRGWSLLIILVLISVIGFMIYQVHLGKISIPSLATIIPSEKVIVSVCVAIIVATLIVFRIFLLAPLLSKLADKEKFITRRVENTWVPIEKSGKFFEGVLTKTNFYMEGNYPSAKVTQGQQRTSFNWLERNGFIWLGIDSPSITRRGTLEIRATRLNPDARTEKLPLKQRIKTFPKLIRELRINFPHYILIADMDLSDGNNASTLVRVDVFVKEPHKLWYGLGRQAYATIDTTTASIVRNAFERYRLEELLYQGEDLATGKENAQDKIEDELREQIIRNSQEGPVTDNLFNFIGIEIRGIQIEEWEYEAPPGFLEAIQKKFLEKAERAKKLEIQKTRAEVAEAAIKALEAEKAEAKKAQETNEARREATVALIGQTNAEEALFAKEMGDNYAHHAAREAIKGTGISVYAPGGQQAPQVLIQTPKPKDKGGDK